MGWVEPLTVGRTERTVAGWAEPSAMGNSRGAGADVLLECPAISQQAPPPAGLASRGIELRFGVDFGGVRVGLVPEGSICRRGVVDLARKGSI